MKKIASVLTAAGVSFLTLTNTTLVLAQTAVPTGVVDQINLKPPGNQGINPSTSLNTILGNIITIVFIVAAVLVLFFLIFGAFEWILSGGDKEKIAHARGRIINALIGLVILALAFLILQVVGNLIHINIQDLNIPALGPNPLTQVPTRAP